MSGAVARILSAIELRPVPFRALLKSYAIMDFRSQHFGRSTGTGAHELLPPLFWVFGQCVFLSGCLSALLFARVDVWFFAASHLAVAAVVSAACVIVEFSEVVIDPADLNVIGHHPVPLRTYAAARLTNLLGYVLAIAVSLTVFPAIVGCGLRDSSWAFAPAYVAASLMTCLLAAGVVVMLFTAIMRRPPGGRVRDALAWTQIVLVAVIFFGGQAVMRDAQDRLEMFAYDPPPWTRQLPTSWLAEAVRHAAWFEARWTVPLGIAAVTTAVFWGVALWGLTRAYQHVQPGTGVWERCRVAPLRRPGELPSTLGSRFTRPGVERAAYWMCVTQLRRDGELRMRTWPALGMLAAVLALGLLSGQLRNPLVSPDETCVMTLAVLCVLATPIPAMLYAMQFSQHHAASWVLATAPAQSGLEFAEAARKAVSNRILLPVLAAVVILFAILWRAPLDALIYGAIGLLTILGAGYASQAAVVRRVPFSAPAARGQSMGPITVIISVIAAGAMLLAAAHFAAAKLGRIATLVDLAALAMLVVILRLWSVRILRRRFGAA